MTIVATDIDGTFLDEHHRIRPDVIDTYCALQDAGIEVVPATGRNVGVIRKAFSKMHDNSEFESRMSWYPGVYNHGAIVYGSSPDKVIFKQAVEPSLVSTVIRLAYEFRDHEKIDPVKGFFTVALYDSVSFSIDHCSQAFHDVINIPYEEWHRRSADADLNGAAYADYLEGVTHMSISAPNEVLKRFVQFWESQSAPELKKLRVVFAIAEQIHFLQADLDKSLGLKMLCEHYGWSQDQIVALGDGENDVEILRWAGKGIAMGNAGEHVKASAKYVTKKNSEGGWCKAIQEHALTTQP